MSKGDVKRGPVKSDRNRSNKDSRLKGRSGPKKNSKKK